MLADKEQDVESTKHEKEEKKTTHRLDLSNSDTQVESMTGNLCAQALEKSKIIGTDDYYGLSPFKNSADSKANKGCIQMQNNKVQKCAQDAKQVDKCLKTLELAMVELRPISKPTKEAQIIQKRNSEGSVDTEKEQKTDIEKSSEPFCKDYNPVAKKESNLASPETTCQYDEINSNETIAMSKSNPVIAVSCQTELSLSECQTPPNTDRRGQSAGTIASVTGDKKEPIDRPRITEPVKPSNKEEINTGTVTTSFVAHNARQTKPEQINCQPLTIVSKIKTNDSVCVSKQWQDRPHEPSMSNVLLSHVNVETAKVKTYGHLSVQQTVQTRPATKDRCRSGQRSSSRTDHSSRVNHYENSSKPAIANGRHKCFSPNSGATRGRSQSLPSYERPYGKRELRRALPRKSNFSCHDTALKEAGFEDDTIAQRKAERLKERLARVANSMNPLLGLSSYVSTGCEPEQIEVVVTEVNNTTDNKQSEANIKNIDAVAAEKDSAIPLVSNEDPSQKLLNTENSPLISLQDNNGPLQHLLGGTLGGLETAGQTRRRRPGSARVEYVECKPLSQYLEYIRDNRQEYINYIRHQQLQQQALRKDKAVGRLIKMGQAFELRHQGGTTRPRKLNLVISDSTDGHASEDGDSNADVIVMAAKALRPRTADPGKYAKSRDKSGGGGRRNADPSTRPLSDHRKSSHGDKNADSSNPTSGVSGREGHNTKEEDHPKTELEKRKLRAEDWTRSVPTHILTRAKLQSLRELGADDSELTKWWEAFKDCHYLRQNTCHT